MVETRMDLTFSGMGAGMDAKTVSCSLCKLCERGATDY